MKQFYSSFIQAFAALSLTVATRASPHNSLAPRDLALVDGTCQPIVYGATQIESGKVCANIDGGTLTIKYTVDPGWTIDTVHAWLGNQPATTAKPPTAPGKMPYTNENGFCTISGLVATCTVPIKPEWRVACGENLYAVTHIAHTSPAGMHETGWGKGPCYDDKGNCAKYWALKTACKCPVVIDYEPIYYTASHALLMRKPLNFTNRCLELLLYHLPHLDCLHGRCA
jgi:hypothetical protein